VPIEFAPQNSGSPLSEDVKLTDNALNATGAQQKIPVSGTAPASSSTTVAANATAPYSASAQNVTLSATVSSAGGTVSSGTVTFIVMNGGTTVGSATTSGTVSGGLATVAYTLPGGTPGGTYTIQANYNASADFTGSSDSSHTLTVDQAPTITSAASATFTVGSNGSLAVTASGYPSASFTETGSLPSGVTLVTNGTLSGTPAAHTAGSYPIVITADNGIAPSATQNFTLTVVPNNRIWIGDPSGTTAAFSATGAPYLTTPESYGGAGVAIDSSGDVWSLNTSGNSVAEFSNTGTVLNSGYTGGGLSTPTSLAIDGSGQVWIANSGSSISVFNSSGSPVSTTAYTGGQLSSPSSIAIDISGNLWIANSGSNSVTEVLGTAAPTNPLATGVANGTPATKP
jgi:hypothetical protein